MHAVEEAIIGQLYDKARFHKLISPIEPKKFYYTRQGGILENLSEMMGTRNVLRWLVPLPHYSRQYHPLYNLEDPSLNSKLDSIGLDYMRFDRSSLKELVQLEYQIEKKVEDDLIKSGFKIRNRVQVPQFLTQMIGGD
jgi:hypothetical protein